MEKVDGYSITVPMPSKEIISETLFEARLTKLLNAKAKLLKKAFNTDTVGFVIKDGDITFNWLKGDADPLMIQATMKFVVALVKLISEGQSVKCKERELHSEKYAMRCFLVRLGFIGDEYKTSRKVLLGNLSGSSAFKNGGANHEISK